MEKFQKTAARGVDSHSIVNFCSPKLLLHRTFVPWNVEHFTTRKLLYSRVKFLWNLSTL